MIAYALVAPAAVLVAGVLGYPLAWEVWASLTDFSSLGDGAPALVGFANYARLLGDPWFWRALAATIAYLVVTSAAKLALGVTLALLLEDAGGGRVREPALRPRPSSSARASRGRTSAVSPPRCWRAPGRGDHA